MLPAKREPPHSTPRRDRADRRACSRPYGNCTPRQQRATSSSILRLQGRGGGITARTLRCRAPPHAVARRGSRVHESSAHWKCPLRPPLLGGANLKRVAARSSRVVAGRAGTHVFRLYSAKRSPCASFEAGQTRVRAARGSLRTALPQHRSRPGAGGVAHMLVAQREQLPPAPRGGADWTGALDAGKARSLQPTHGEKRSLLMCRGGADKCACRTQSTRLPTQVRGPPTTHSVWNARTTHSGGVGRVRAHSVCIEQSALRPKWGSSSDSDQNPKAAKSHVLGRCLRYPRVAKGASIPQRSGPHVG